MLYVLCVQRFVSHVLFCVVLCDMYVVCDVYVVYVAHAVSVACVVDMFSCYVRCKLSLLRVVYYEHCTFHVVIVVCIVHVMRCVLCVTCCLLCGL